MDRPCQYPLRQLEDFPSSSTASNGSGNIPMQLPSGRIRSEREMCGERPETAPEQCCGRIFRLLKTLPLSACEFPEPRGSPRLRKLIHVKKTDRGFVSFLGLLIVSNLGPNSFSTCENTLEILAIRRYVQTSFESSIMTDLCC